MHRVIKAYLDNFSSQFSLSEESESSQFEKFVTHVVLSSKCNIQYNFDEIVTSSDDDGIDAIAIIVDEEIITLKEDIIEIFSTSKRNHDVSIVFIQSKTSENFDLGEFLKFKEGILKFFSDEYIPSDSVINNAQEIFNVSLKNVTKIREGLPSFVCRFVTTGLYKKPDAFEEARLNFEKELQELTLFSKIDIEFIDRDKLSKLWISTYTSTEACLQTYSTATFPAISSINEAYLAVVTANEFVKSILTTEDGNLRVQVFEENVRAYLGNDNPVNKSIESTLISDSATRFPILNNGITIVSPEVQLQGNRLFLKDFQIVNGCQTANILFKNKDALQDIMLHIKVIETQSGDVFSEIVRATNSQTRIDDPHFYSLLPITKKIEQYFNTYENEDSRLYLERRYRQYAGKDIPNIRIYSLHEASRCVAAMFCRRPDLAARYTPIMYKELSGEIFSEDVKEIIFYAACITMYRLNLLLSNKTIDSSLRKFKWHILPLVWCIQNGKEEIKIKSRKIEKKAQDIINIMSKHNAKAINLFQQAAQVCYSIGDISSDQLKRQNVLHRMLSAL